MEFFVALRQLLEDDTSRLRIEVIDFPSFTLTLEDSRVWFFVHKHINDGRVKVCLLGLDSDSANSFD